jgi:RimJ/RimL family protein N-acetyltransferase
VIGVIISGKRLTLREMTLNDWPAVHDYASRPEACRYQEWGPNTPDESRAFVAWNVAEARKRPRRLYRFAAVRNDTGRLIGDGGLEIRSERFRQGEISYIVHPNYWGQGYATEIARMLLRFGFENLNLHRIMATCDPRNVASVRVLEKAGMTYEGRQRHTMLLRDGWRDSSMYSVLEEEWVKGAGSLAPSRPRG